MGEGSGRKKGQLTASEVRQGKARQTTRARWRMERRRGVGWAGRAAQDWLVGLVGRWSRAACLGGGLSERSSGGAAQRSDNLEPQADGADRAGTGNGSSSTTTTTGQTGGGRLQSTRS